MNQCILLTACVNPGKMTLTHLKDATERRNQYKAALNFYLNETDIPIVFCENTNTDFSSEYQQYINSGRLEYITFEGNNYDVNKGKGYGEANIIKYAIHHSQIIEKSILLIKITGRLICKNIRKIINLCNNPKYIYSNIYQDKRKKRIFDSRIIIGPLPFWKEDFLPLTNEINDSINLYFEHIIFNAAQMSKNKGYRVKEFWFPVKIIGTSGTSGITYSTDLLFYLSFYVHFFLHKMRYYGPILFWK